MIWPKTLLTNMSMHLFELVFHSVNFRITEDMFTQNEDIGILFISVILDIYLFLPLR